jgi:Carboxypeptidase regulatory-like domain/Polysaccharide lyase family 4, domain II/Tetratricopeptide repeat
MKRRILVSIGILLGACTTLFAQSPQELFNQALVQERAAGNLEQAAQLFQQVARASSDDRSLAVQGLMGAARSYQKLGQTDQSKRLYDEVIRSYADQKEQVALARQYMADTGVVQGRVVRAGTGEPVPEAKVWLSDGPVDPAAFATLQAFFKSRRVEITFPPNGTIDEKYIQNVRDTAAAQGVSFGNPGVQAAIAQFQSANDSRFHAIADSQGNFTIRNVLPGKYSISSEREGYFSASADSTAGDNVSVAPGRTAVVEMPMTRGATISGRVTDGAGQPLTNTTVIGYSVVYRNGFPLLVPAVAKTTDDRGEYRLAWLTAGEYLIAVKPDVTPEIAMSTSTAGVPPVDGGLPAPKTYYPGTTDAANAIPVFVRGESPISGIDIQARKVETFHVKGTIRSHVPRATTYITGNFSMGPRNANLPNDPSATVMDTRMDKAGDDYVGEFDIKGVPTGSYTLSAWAREQNPDGGSQLAFALANLDVSNNDVTGLVLDIYPTVRVNGSVVVNGTAPGSVQARISLLVDSRNAVGGVYQGLSQRAVLADGQTGAFMIPAVQTGHFHALVGAGLPPDYYVADIRQGGVSVFDSGFDVGKESPSPIQVVINSGARTVEGTVRDSMGKPVAGATAVLVPPRERRHNRAMYFTAKSDATGHFKIQGVAPGNYSLFSWQNMPDGAYYNDRFVSRNEDAARKVNVVQSSATGADILLIPPIGR